jgi:hypothetical protein
MKKRLILSFALALMLVLVPITASGSTPGAVSGPAPSAGAAPGAVSGFVSSGKSSSVPNVVSYSASMAELQVAPIVECDESDDYDWYTLTAAQHHYVGDIGVCVLGGNLKVLINTIAWEPGPENDCYMTETHLAVGETLADIPQTRSGNPKVGHFPYAREYDTPVWSDIYLVPIPDGGLPVVMAVHAVVTCPGWDEPETAWGSQCTQCCDFPGRSWATWFQYPEMLLP